MNITSTTSTSSRCLSPADYPSPALDSQLELGLDQPRPCSPGNRRQRRLTRAHWWFQCMRQAVDRACDWQPVSPARPEQTWFPQTHREPTLAPQLRGTRQLCE